MCNTDFSKVQYLASVLSPDCEALTCFRRDLSSNRLTGSLSNDENLEKLENM